ncbi:sensor domain-containing protein [Mycobacterium hubeiense]|uniref:sensor domain-containing protein n=1 Tax=Mycobacterium hubeiense TaxID=1867256 RepID=UPI001E5D2012|nr:sensor domain-containing protein [Mycobacterium sp. QGD 101]
MLGVGDLQSTWDYPALGDASSEPRNCGGIAAPALRQAYIGSGYLSTRIQYFQNDLNQEVSYTVAQQVSNFQSSPAASGFVVAQNNLWRSCANQKVTLHTVSETTYWRAGMPFMAGGELTGGVLTVTMVQEADFAWSCQRALSARRNVVIDVVICGRHGSTKAPELVQKIADRMPPACTARAEPNDSRCTPAVFAWRWAKR